MSLTTMSKYYMDYIYKFLGVFFRTTPLNKMLIYCKSEVLIKFNIISELVKNRERRGNCESWKLTACCLLSAPLNMPGFTLYFISFLCFLSFISSDRSQGISRRRAKHSIASSTSLRKLQVKWVSCIPPLTWNNGSFNLAELSSHGCCAVFII